MRDRSALTSMVSMFALMFLALPVWAQAPFYEGKAVTVLIGANRQPGDRRESSHLGNIFPARSGNRPTYARHGACWPPVMYSTSLTRQLRRSLPPTSPSPSYQR
jgi:hypothetical protein